MKHGIPELGDFGGLGLGRTTATVLHQKNYEDDPHAVGIYNVREVVGHWDS